MIILVFLTNSNYYLDFSKLSILNLRFHIINSYHSAKQPVFSQYFILYFTKDGHFNCLLNEKSKIDNLQNNLKNLSSILFFEFYL